MSFTEHTHWAEYVMISHQFYYFSTFCLLFVNRLMCVYCVCGFVRIAVMCVVGKFVDTNVALISHTHTCTPFALIQRSSHAMQSLFFLFCFSKLRYLLSVFVEILLLFLVFFSIFEMKTNTLKMI